MLFITSVSEFSFPKMLSAFVINSVALSANASFFELSFSVSACSALQ